MRCPLRCSVILGYRVVGESMLKRLATITGALLVLVIAPSAAQAKRHCGSIKVSGTPFQVFVEAGSASCVQARAVMWSLYHRRHREVCYRNDSSCRNGRPTDRANTVILVGVWRCGTGAGGGGCTHGRERISTAYLESAEEKVARVRREAAENKKSVLACENNPHLALVQEGDASKYIYECLPTAKLAEECGQNFCREPMYGESDGWSKWEGRVREACRAVGGVPYSHTRLEAGVLEYACATEEGATTFTWVSLPYMPPEAYAEWSAA